MDQRGAGPAIPAATTTRLGCWFSNAPPQKADGHVLMATFKAGKGETAAKRGGAVSYKWQPQLIHRISVRAFGSWEEQQKMFEARPDVSRLCHEPTCFNPQHLVLEEHADNMTRQKCNARLECACVLPCLQSGHPVSVQTRKPQPWWLADAERV